MHILKFVRTCLASSKIVRDGYANEVKWSFIESLNKLQEKEGLHVANKLKTSQIIWFKQKMKINLAVQVVSYIWCKL